jgi:peptide-methionine (R)-S-oxide reductase
MKPYWMLLVPLVPAILFLASRPESKTPGAASLRQGGERDVALSSHSNPNRKIMKTDAEWKQLLTPEQYEVLRLKGTEAPFSGKYWNFTEKGDYACAACGAVLFKSDTKFDAGCGWPSFWEAADKSVIELKEDNSHGMHRVEVLCKKCGGHLGHVFDDGPNPTGQRFCINSASIAFKKKADEKSEDKPNK